MSAWNEGAVAAAGDTLARTLRGTVDRAGSPGGIFRTRPAEPFLASSAIKKHQVSFAGRHPPKISINPRGAARLRTHTHQTRGPRLMMFARLLPAGSSLLRRCAPSTSSGATATANATATGRAGTSFPASTSSRPLPTSGRASSSGGPGDSGGDSGGGRDGGSGESGDQGTSTGGDKGDVRASYQYCVQRVRQGLTLLHLSAQLEPSLTQETTLHPLDTP